MTKKKLRGVQDQYAKKSICYGCGPANKNGLQIKSTRFSGGLELWFNPAEEHQAFPGVVNGGIIGALFDCHGNWAAAVGLLDAGHFKKVPPTVTANYSVQFLKPTPFGISLHVVAKINQLKSDRAEVEMSLYAEQKLCARGSGLFVAVRKEHPAFKRW